MSDSLTRLHNAPSVTLDRSTQNRLATGLALAGATGGALLFLDLGLHVFRPLGRSYFILAILMALFLPCVPAAFLRRGAIAAGWTHTIAIAGLSTVGIGACLWLFAFVTLFQQPDRAFVQHLTPAGSLLMATGMLLFGTATLASKKLALARSCWPILVGAYFPLQLVLQLAFFLNGRDDSPGPNGLLLGAWGIVWVLAAGATLIPNGAFQSVTLDRVLHRK